MSAAIPEIYNIHTPLLVAVDCIIFGFGEGELKLLAVKRQMDPARGEWSLMGGFLGERESLDEAAARILHQLTGLTDVYLDQLYAHSDPERDPGARVVSVSYYALIKISEQNQELAKEHDAVWFRLSELPLLIFDHNQMVDMALQLLRKQAKTKPVGFELLPEKFTLPQLQALYEAIYQKEIDRRNFRKSILSMDMLEKLDEKDKKGSRKGAWLYRFNLGKYESLRNRGFFFNISV